MAVSVPERTLSSSRPPGQAGGDGPRQFSSRVQLGGTRALVGGLLIAASAVGLFAAYTGADDPPTTRFVVAATDVAAGARLEEDHLALAAMDLAPGVEARAFQQAEALVGTTLLAPLAAGELVQSSVVVSRPGGADHRELTIALDAVALAASVSPGERVDVLATYGTGPGAFTQVVATDVLVTGLTSAGGGLGAPGERSLTLAVAQPEVAVAVAHAHHAAELTVVRATGAGPMDAPRFHQPAFDPVVPG